MVLTAPVIRFTTQPLCTSTDPMPVSTEMLTLSLSVCRLALVTGLVVDPRLGHLHLRWQFVALESGKEFA
jgi:hypothetical protein